MKPERLRSPAMLDPAGTGASVGIPTRLGGQEGVPSRGMGAPSVRVARVRADIAAGPGVDRSRGGGGAYAGTARSAARAAGAAKPNATSATLPRKAFSC